LLLKGGNSIVRGLAITRFIHDGSLRNGFGIVLDNQGGNLIEANYLGVDMLGTTAKGNTSGVAIDEPSTGNVIANNVISGNELGGIQITASGNLVRGNRIGTDPSGSQAIANLTRGVLLWDRNGTVDTANNTIGGVTPEMRNLISGNFLGIEFDGVRVTGNAVLGNYIGTNFTGITALSNTQDGIEIEDSPGNTIGGPTVESRNVISGNGELGIHVFGTLASGNLIQGNYIGTDFTGRFAVGTSLGGVEISDAKANRIEDNVISGHSRYGVFIFGIEAQGNTVDGNLIGTDLTGTSDIGNGKAGVGIFDAVTNVIGGTKRNVISGNDIHGVYITGGTATGNKVLGNFIGTDITGFVALHNTFDGVRIVDAPRNVIGGLTAKEQNLISGNARNGVHISGGDAVGNTVLGNLIGTESTGSTALGSQQVGILISDASRNTVGGITFAAGNVISGNSVGVQFDGFQAKENVVAANLIGTTKNGKAALPNVRGVYVTGAPDNTIGGTAIEAGNVISGNSLVGIEIVGATAARNKVIGNYIGTDILGTLPLPNDDGVFVGEAPNNTIGGTGVSEGNVISANRRWGITIEGASASGNVVAGNLIGTDKLSVTAMGNGSGGVLITNASSNVIGGTVAGAGNVISGSSGGTGLEITGAGAMRNLVAGNLIGIDQMGALVMPNLRGVLIVGGSGNTIGGRSDAARNVISGNLETGIEIIAAATVVEGNYVGTNRSGQAALANHVGILVGGPANFIGGGSGGGNVISGNTDAGIQIDGPLATGNLIQNNRIGTNASGNGPVPNEVGIFLTSAHSNVIGGGSQGNLISGNRATGIDIKGGRQNRVLGNRIGTDLLGLGAIGNGGGILLRLSADSNTIGGTSASDRNVISGNTSQGVSLNVANKNLIAGNYIGTQNDGTSPLGNGADGILLSLADMNTIGGSTAGAGNTIAHNKKHGVNVESGTGNTISRNSFFGNTGLGIDLGDDGVTINDLGDPDSGANNLQNDPSLQRAVASATDTTVDGIIYSSPNTTYTFDIFLSPTCGLLGFGEGVTFLDSLTSFTCANGTLSFGFGNLGPLPVGNWITATATDSNGNTSEFSRCIRIAADGDSDGVSDDEEDGGPNGGDGNQDGVPDSQQPDVATLLNVVNGAFATLVAGVGSVLQSVRSLTNPAPLTSPPGVAFNQGIFSFGVQVPSPGASTTVSIIPSSFVPVTTYYKYGPTPGNPNDHWYDFSFAGTTGAEILSDRIVLHLVDGAIGDSDLTANGEIVDPGGPAAPIAPGLRITGDARPLPAFVGQTFAYSFNVTNHSPDTATDVSFTDTLPRGVHFVSASTSFGATLTESGGTVAGNLGPLFSGQSVDVTVTTVLTDPGEIRNTATVSGSVPDLDPSDNTVTLVTQVSATPTIGRATDLSVTMIDTPDPAEVGRPLTYTILVSNDGPQPTRQVTLTDTLPADVRFVSASGRSNLGSPPPSVLRVRFDYSFDTNNFFDTQQKKDVLEAAAEAILARLGDDLAAITPGADKSWTATFSNPASGFEQRIVDLAVAENELVVFVGGRDLGTGNHVAGRGGPGGLQVDGSAEWRYLVGTRGESGAGEPAPDDFGPWGGAISFNRNPAVAFHFGPTAAGLDPGEVDFYSVALHELMHVLGFGASSSWRYSVNNVDQSFVGPNARIEYDLGGAVPLEPGLDHWSEGTTDAGAETAMDPEQSNGIRTPLTLLDLAGLDDIGWDVTDPAAVGRLVPCANQGGVVTCDSDRLRVGETVTVTIVVVPEHAGVLSNRVTVMGEHTELDPTNNSAFAATKVDPRASIVVNTSEDGTSDAAHTTLREAIELANTNPGLDTISFNIPGPGPHSIRVISTLPTITDPVVIDATTEPDFAGLPIVELDGSLGGGGANGLHITAGGSTVRGLVINRFRTDADGEGGRGIWLENGGGNRIAGNYIGTDISGTSAQGNESVGVLMYRSHANTIGGTTAADRNVISGNQWHGVFLANAANNLVQGNHIGTDVSGTVVLGNDGSGIEIDGYGSASNQVGGASTGERNVISGNVAGVGIVNLAHENLLEGNFIGTNAAGNSALGNGTGVRISRGYENTIGGAALGAGNVVSGNNGFGVSIVGPGLFAEQLLGLNLLLGNRIGTSEDHVTPLGNASSGVVVDVLGAATIGGPNEGDGNTIAYNGGAGVFIGLTTSVNVRRNAIFANAGLGIDLYSDGVLWNDPEDFDLDINDKQNYPVLTRVTSAPGATTIAGSLDGPSYDIPVLGIGARNIIIEFFATPSCDSSGYGEGAAYLGSTTVFNRGLVGFEVTLPVGVPDGYFVTATATAVPLGNTSEFSACVEVLADSDADGVVDRVEDAGPNGGDANDDGLPDGQQGNVTSLPNAVDGRYVVLESDAGTPLHEVRALAVPPTADNLPSITFPLGFFEFTILAGAAMVTIRLPAGQSFDAVHDLSSAIADRAVLTAFGYDGSTGAEVLTDRAVVHWLDGQRGDHFGPGIGARIGLSLIGPNARDALVVTNTNDSGAGSLRAAIVQANALPGKDVVTFAVPATDLGHVYYRDDGIAGKVSLDRVAATTAADDATITDIDPDHPHSWWRIRPTSSPNPIQPGLAKVSLPWIADPIIIDGYTQPEALPATHAAPAVLRIELDGSQTPNPVNGLTILGGDSVVRGLVINRFRYDGYRGGAQIEIATAYGLPIPERNHIEGNYLGTDISGSFGFYEAYPDPSQRFGVVVSNSPDNSIGGTTPAARNLISGLGAGVHIAGDWTQPVNPATGNRVLGNYIGTDRTGTRAVANLSGISVSNTADTAIGAPGAGNLISANGTGVTIEHFRPDVSGVTVQNSLIGTDVTGTAPLGNGTGIYVFGWNTIIGGAEPGGGNVISASEQGGIRILGAGDGPKPQPMGRNVIQGNWIGTDRTGTMDLGNGNPGIQITSSRDNLIGGAGAGNVIAFNGGSGVVVNGRGEDGQAAFGNSILSNRIFANGRLGIDLAEDGVTSNDPGDRDGIRVPATFPTMNVSPLGDFTTVEGTLQAGPNTEYAISLYFSAGFSYGQNVTTDDQGLANFSVTAWRPGDLLEATAIESNPIWPNWLQNFPILSAVRSEAFATTVKGTLDSMPSATYRLEFYVNSQADESGHGEGQRLFATADVTTDDSGLANFAILVPTPLVPGQFVTATATDPDGNTSEFSAAVRVFAEGNADLSVSIIDSPDPVTAGSGFTYTFTVTNHGPDDATGVTLTFKPHVTLISVELAQGTWRWEQDDVIFEFGSVPAGALLTNKIIVSTGIANTVFIMGVVVGDQVDPDPSNNVALESTSIVSCGVAPLPFATYLGGSNSDHPWDAAVDIQGNIYVVGSTLSSDFPVVNAYQPEKRNPSSWPTAFITKFDPTGSVVYSTYLGGSISSSPYPSGTIADWATGVAVDDFGNAYVTGFTSSGDFPVLNGLPPELSEQQRSQGDAFLAKFDPSGGLLFSTLLGGECLPLLRSDSSRVMAGAWVPMRLATSAWLTKAPRSSAPLVSWARRRW
jgi:uncharacterized repeat protein (TIGR01451 family)